MPKSAPRPCKHIGCVKLVHDGAFCDDHKRPRSGSFSDRSRGTRHERGYGSAWDVLRKIVLRRDSGLCQPCHEQGRLTVATMVDHIKPKAEGGTDDLDNLRSICRACHTLKTDAEKNRYRGRGGRKV